MVGRWGRPRPSRRRRSYRRCAQWPQTGRARTAWGSQGPTATGGGDHRNLHRITALRRRRPRRRCRVIGRRIWTHEYPACRTASYAAIRTIAILDKDGTALHLKTLHDPSPPITLPTLPIGAHVVLPAGKANAAQFFVDWANWCGADPSPITVTLTLPNGGTLAVRPIPPDNGEPTWLIPRSLLFRVPVRRGCLPSGPRDAAMTLQLGVIPHNLAALRWTFAPRPGEREHPGLALFD